MKWGRQDDMTTCHEQFRDTLIRWTGEKKHNETNQMEIATFSIDLSLTMTLKYIIFMSKIE